MVPNGRTLGPPGIGLVVVGGDETHAQFEVLVSFNLG